MSYIENPKTKDSGVICAIPQTGTCPNNCPDCFFQSGRSYLEPLEENLPNMPSSNDEFGRIVRINDGLDSNVDRDKVIEYLQHNPWAFCNTIDPYNLKGYMVPVVLTINPGRMTDNDFHELDDPPPNLMFIRFRTNMWNLSLCDQAVDYYSDREVPIVLTFMAYHREANVKHHLAYYSYRDRTTNKYWAINFEAWRRIMEKYKCNKWVYSCGTEGVASTCRFCGNCLREYYATMERMRDDE